MHARRFDLLAKTLSAAGTRRAIWRLLTAFPFASGLAALLLDEESKAGRHRRRKTRKHRDAGGAGIIHDNRKRKNKNKNKKKKRQKPDETDPTPPPGPPPGPPPPGPGCIPEPLEQSCASRCGPALDNCDNPVDCGACNCTPACTTCQSCNTSTRQCENHIGTCCPGGRCDNGDCVPCLGGQHCIDGTCVCDDTSCSDGCCDEEICRGFGEQSVTRCGAGGAICFPCDTGEDCCGTPRACVNLQTDPNNCGECGTTCTGGECVAGTCQHCVCPGENTCFDTIGEAIAVVSAGSIIHVCPGEYRERFTIDKSLQLIGDEVGINVVGENGGRVVNVLPNATVTLQNLHITGGHDDEGGGIRNEGDLTLIGCALDGNSATSDGGGLWNFGTVTILSATEITGNEAFGRGGGIANFGHLSLTDCGVLTNFVYCGGECENRGAGIFNAETLELINSNLNENFACNDPDGPCTLDNCVGAGCP